MSQKTILHIVGARPNYMKIAPLMAALRGVPDVEQRLVNTGQHYDDAMAGVFFRELGLPAPDRDLGVGSGTHATQTAAVMTRLEELCLEQRPDLVVVVGDVNSTMASALVASKLLIPLAHVEAGLRSFDRTMPEEINRLITDQLSDLLLTPSEDANANLRREGIPDSRVHLVGNIMIDTLFLSLPHAGFDRVVDRFQIERGRYAVLTLHRPSNVDVPEVFDDIMRAIAAVAAEMPVVFPVHPRTRARLSSTGGDRDKGIRFVEPLGYLDFLALTSHARIVLTDSGGLQEETTALGIPCLTLRTTTERPITITQGTNRLVGVRSADILAGFQAALRAADGARRPPLWDGRTAERIVDVFRTFLLD